MIGLKSKFGHKSVDQEQGRSVDQQQDRSVNLTQIAIINNIQGNYIFAQKVARSLIKLSCTLAIHSHCWPEAVLLYKHRLVARWG